MYEMSTKVGPSLPNLSLDLFCPITYYIICAFFFFTRISVFRKEFLIKNSICRVENDISLCMVHKSITIILIPNKYHQFRT